MIQITLTIDELDYTTLAERYLPLAGEKLRESGNPLGMLLSNGMGGAMAKSLVAGAPRSVKDKLAADLINANAAEIRKKIEAAAEEKDVGLCVRSIHAEVKRNEDA